MSLSLPRLAVSAGLKPLSLDDQAGDALVAEGEPVVQVDDAAVSVTGPGD